VQIVFAVVGLAGVIASAVSDVACIAFFVVYARRRGIGLRGLGFTRVPAKWIGAAILVGISAWYVNLVVVTLLHVPEGKQELLKGLLEELPVAPTIGFIALLPALAEEILFRGVLARGLATTRRPLFAIGVSSAVFGMYHVLPAQVVATFMLGCLLGLFTLRSRSIVPSVVVHFLNNAIAIVVSRDSIPGVTKAIENHSFSMLAICTLLLGAGIFIALKDPA
jgi:membrane protease YdiL (CAAX protease family)